MPKTGILFARPLGVDVLMRKLCVVVLVLIFAGGCTPTVKVATDEPITINLNVNIKHEILIKVDKELDNVFSKDNGLF